MHRHRSSDTAQDAVVTKDMPEQIVVSNPARVLRYLSEKEVQDARTIMGWV